MRTPSGIRDVPKAASFRPSIRGQAQVQLVHACPSPCLLRSPGVRDHVTFSKPTPYPKRRGETNTSTRVGAGRSTATLATMANPNPSGNERGWNDPERKKKKTRKLLVMVGTILALWNGSTAACEASHGSRSSSHLHVPACRKAAVAGAYVVPVEGDTHPVQLVVFSGDPRAKSLASTRERRLTSLSRPQTLIDDLWVFQAEKGARGTWECIYDKSQTVEEATSNSRRKVLAQCSGYRCTRGSHEPELLSPWAVQQPHYYHGPTPRPRWKSATASFHSSLPHLSFANETVGSQTAMMMFGGDALDTKPIRSYLGDLWLLQETGSNSFRWKRVRQGSPRPRPRRGHAAASVRIDGAHFFYIQGGRESNKARSKFLDVWRFGPCQLDYGNYVDHVPTLEGEWSLEFDGEGKPGIHQPSGRQGQTLVAAEKDGKSALFLLFGRNDTAYFDDMWMFDISYNSWTEIRAKEGQAWPEGRDHHVAMAYAPRQEIWVYGGRGGDTRYTHSHPLGDLWVYSIPSCKWNEVKDMEVKPSPRYLVGHSDTGAGQLYVFGGEGKHKRNDLWVLDVTGEKPIWQQLSKNDCEKPKATKKRIKSQPH